jgi:ribose/xylose/arabinose/galactoside ABC-type transport system permease subunit
MAELGKVLVALGLLIALVGLVLWTGFGRGWLGQLPGDIRFSRGNAHFFFPLTTCLAISVIASLILWWFRK